MLYFIRIVRGAAWCSGPFERGAKMTTLVYRPQKGSARKNPPAKHWGIWWILTVALWAAVAAAVLFGCATLASAQTPAVPVTLADAAMPTALLMEAAMKC